MTNWKRLLVVLLTVFGCVGCDQVSKSIARTSLPRHEVVSLAGDSLRLHYTENCGAFLGLGAALPETPRALLLRGAVGAFLTGLLVFLLRSTDLPSWSLVAWSLVCGGGLGNWVDRVTRSGYVVDFLQCGVGWLRTGIFNLADLAVTTGAVMLVLGSLLRGRASSETTRGT